MIRDIFFGKRWWLIHSASGWTPAVTLRSMLNVCAIVCAGYPLSPPPFTSPPLYNPLLDFPLHVCFTSSQVEETNNTTLVQFQWTLSKFHVQLVLSIEQTIQNSVEMGKAKWIFWMSLLNFWVSNKIFVKEFKFM